MSFTQNILATTDFSEASRPGLVKAAELAAEVGAKVTLCHVLERSALAPMSAQGEAAEQLQGGADVEGAIHEALLKVAKKYFSAVDEVKTALVTSSCAEWGICDYANKEGVDLIVISTHGRTGIEHLLIGSVAEKVVRHAPCPVLTVRAPRDE